MIPAFSPQHKPPALYAPYRFGVVEDDLFRGGFPKDRNHRFLRRLQLNTILSLTPNVGFDSLGRFCEKHNIDHIHIHVDKVKDDEPPLTFSLASQILQLMTDATKLPMYIHCLDGTTVTGVMIMLLRRLQMWSIPCAIAERSRYLGGDGTVASEEQEFVEKFNGEFELANIAAIPKWLWGGQINFKKHPTMRVRVPPPAPNASAASSISSSMSASFVSTASAGSDGQTPSRLLMNQSVYEPMSILDHSDRPPDLLGRPSLTTMLSGRMAQSPQGSSLLMEATVAGETSLRRRVVDALQSRNSQVAADVAASTPSDREARKLLRIPPNGEQLSQTLDALALEI
ncbi:hypothetical protein HDU97_008423 [Phlyctochytrium planicorne]|nr:hypothetical protein HDU97_008423 [Phlyctochytrium planicorne]